MHKQGEQLTGSTWKVMAQMDPPCYDKGSAKVDSDDVPQSDDGKSSSKNLDDTVSAKKVDDDQMKYTSRTEGSSEDEDVDDSTASVPSEVVMVPATQTEPTSKAVTQETRENVPPSVETAGAEENQEDNCDQCDCCSEMVDNKMEKQQANGTNKVFVAKETNDSTGAGKGKSLGDLAYLIVFWLMILAMISNGIIELHDPHSVVSKNIDPAENQTATIAQISNGSMDELNSFSEVSDDNSVADMKGAMPVSTTSLERLTQNSKASKDVDTIEIESDGLKQESVVEHGQLKVEAPIQTMEENTNDGVQDNKNRLAPESPTKQHQRNNRVARWAQKLFRRNRAEVPS